MKRLLNVNAGMLAAVLAGVAAAAVAGDVQMKEDTIMLPTYAPGGYDKTPIFFTGRVYQGAQGRVYPYPMQDVLHDGKVDETYKYLVLENEWLQMGLLPEHGGHLLNFTDKKTGFEIFYRQHVVKPALIGMLGAWISGGVEWNFPHHHRAHRDADRLARRGQQGRLQDALDRRDRAAPSPEVDDRPLAAP